MKSLIISKFAGPMIRHGATVLGTWLMAEGYADESTSQAIVGGLTAAGGLGLSFLEKLIRA